MEIEHVVLIGIDGFSSKSLEYVDLPTIKSIMEDGSYTLTKRSVLPSSSAPNWASMFMGVPTEIHGYTQWGSQTPEIPGYYEYEKNIFPTIFQILKQQKSNYTQGYVYEWEGMKYLADTLSFDYHEISQDYLDNKTRLADMACSYIQDSKPNMMAVIFASPDDMGHKYGFTSQEYYQDLLHVDNEIARIIRAYKLLGIFDKTVFIITSDHGGIDKNHGGVTLDEMETPFIIYGNGLKKGYKIEGLMMQYDIAPTIADIYGVEIPDIWRGKSIYQQIHDNSSINTSSDEEIEYTPEITETIYYDMQGNKYHRKPKHGLFIRKEIYTNGKMSSTKVIH